MLNRPLRIPVTSVLSAASALLMVALTLLIPHSGLRAAPANTKHLRLGAVLSLTGPAAPHGTAIQDGINYAVSQLEKDGWKVEVKFEDDGTEAKRTISAIERATQSGIQFFIGPTWGMLAEPAAPVLRRTHSLSLQPCNSSEFVSGGKDTFFFLLPPLRKFPPVLAEWMKDKNLKSAAVVVAVSPWGELNKKLFQEAAQLAGVAIVFEESFQYGEENTALPPLVTKMRSKSPEVILTTSSKEITALLVKQLERQRVQTLVLSPDLGDGVLEQLIAPESEWIEGYFLRPKPLESFAKEFRDWKKSEPKKYTDFAYDSVLALAEAVQAAGEDPTEVKKYLETKFDRQGKSGRIRFDHNHDQIDGEYEIIKSVSKKTL